jgi:hypothetical protein
VIDGGTGSMSAQTLLPALPRGNTTIEAEFLCEILDGDPDSSGVLLSTPLLLSKPITVVGKGDPILEVLRDDGLADEFRSAITLRGAKARPQGGNGCMVNLWFEIGRTPADAAFQVFLRTRDDSASPREFEFLSVAISDANPVPNLGLAGFVDGCTPGRYDIVLRPSLERAEQAFAFTNAWLGEDIVIEDVELSPEGISEPASPSTGSAR